MTSLKKNYLKLIRVEHTFRHPFLLLIRLYWGISLIVTGIGKWLNAPEVAKFFGDLHLPFPHFTAHFVGSIEFLGGVSLVLGFLTPLFTPLLIILLMTAYSTAHIQALQTIFTTPSAFTEEAPFLFLLATLIIFCFGPGLFSLDHYFQKRL